MQFGETMSTPEEVIRLDEHEEAIKLLQQSPDYYKNLGLTDKKIEFINKYTTIQNRIDIAIVADGDKEYESKLYNMLLEDLNDENTNDKLSDTAQQIVDEKREKILKMGRIDHNL
jgi:hypothetical protein